MTRSHRIFAACAIVFTMLIALVGTIAIGTSSGQTASSGGTTTTSLEPVPGSVTTTPAPTDNVPAATPEERKPTVTAEQCHERIGASEEKDRELQEQGITAEQCGLLLVELCQKVDFDGVRALGESDPSGKCAAVMAGVSTTQNTAPTSTAPGATAPPGTTPGSSAPPTTATPTPRQPDVVDLMIYLQKVSMAEGRVQGVGVTCEANCVLRDGITADTPEGMFAQLMSKGLVSPVFLDDAARTIAFQTGQEYTDTREVGDAAKAGSDTLIVLNWIKDPSTPTMLERGILPAGTTLYNTVVQEGKVVQFSYTTNRDRVYLKIWKGDTFLMWFDSCGNRTSDRPTPGVPETPKEPPHDDTTTTTTPPPTGGPTPTTTPPACPPGTIWNPVTKKCGKLDTHPVGPNSPVPTQVQGPGPTHPAGPPNTDIEHPNPTTGCNPTCPGATTPTTRPGPPPTVPPIVTSTTYQPPPVATTMPPP